MKSTGQPVASTNEAIRRLLSKCESDEEQIGVLKNELLMLDSHFRNQKTVTEELREKVKCLHTELKSKEEENSSLNFNYERIKKRLNILQNDMKKQVNDNIIIQESSGGLFGGLFGKQDETEKLKNDILLLKGQLDKTITDNEELGFRFSKASVELKNKKNEFEDVVKDLRKEKSLMEKEFEEAKDGTIRMKRELDKMAKELFDAVKNLENEKENKEKSLIKYNELMKQSQMDIDYIVYKMRDHSVSYQKLEELK